MGPERIEIGGREQALTVRDFHGVTVARLAPGARASISSRGDEVRFEGPDGATRTRGLRLTADAGGAIRVRAGDASRSYRGTVEVSADGGTSRSLRVVNKVDLEEYVAAVVSAEYGLDDLEGAKAMAVVVRTYAIRGMDGRADAAYDLSDHDGDQVYRGAGTVTQVARLAAEETAGEILTYDGMPIDAVYSASSGGHTANNEDVWNGAPHPYLRGRRDPWDGGAPSHEWTWSIERGRLHRMIEEQFDVRPRAVEVDERSGDGRARSIRIDAANGRDLPVSASDFRSSVARTFGAQTLRSTLFDIRVDGDRYVFDGRGYGHGVGLSQWGAHGMSQAGKSYRDILDFYYTDVRLEKRESAAPDWAVAVADNQSVLPTAMTLAGAADDDRTMQTSPPVASATRADAAGPRIQAWGSVREAGRKNPGTTRRVGW